MNYPQQHLDHPNCRFFSVIWVALIMFWLCDKRRGLSVRAGALFYFLIELRVDERKFTFAAKLKQYVSPLANWFVLRISHWLCAGLIGWKWVRGFNYPHGRVDCWGMTSEGQGAQGSSSALNKATQHKNPAAKPARMLMAAGLRGDF